jgi:hypothetical protein
LGAAHGKQIISVKPRGSSGLTGIAAAWHITARFNMELYQKLLVSQLTASFNMELYQKFLVSPSSPVCLNMTMG